MSTFVDWIGRPQAPFSPSSSFRIGKYDTKWTSTTYACMNGAPWIRLAFKAIQVDFISVFVERIGPRLKRILTIYHKIRYELRVLGPKYRFLPIGFALRRSNFFSPSWTCPPFHVFLPSPPLVFTNFKVSLVFEGGSSIVMWLYDRVVV